MLYTRTTSVGLDPTGRVVPTKTPGRPLQSRRWPRSLVEHLVHIALAFVASFSYEQQLGGAICSPLQRA